jgi:hypothetical protein
MMDWLLDLDRLAWGAEGVRFGFERPLAGWMWITIVVAAFVVAGWSYWRLAGSTRVRVALAAVRALTIVALVVLVSGPRLVKTEEVVERDWVLAVVDRSLSLTIEDVAPEGPAPGPRRSRDAQLRAAIAETWPGWAALSAEREVVWLGFGGGAFELESPEAPEGSAPAPVALGEPDGDRTALGAAIEAALSRAVARPVSAVVVVSDGRSEDQISRAAMRRLQADRIPVHTVALGSPEPIGDVAVRRVDAPRATFVGDVIPVRARVEWVGGRGSMGATVRLVDEATAQTLDERRVTLAEGDERTLDVALSHRSAEEGERRWRVEVIPDGADLLADNNAERFELEMVDRPLRVLFVDGYPRWERRYLANLLLREASVLSSSLMLAADRKYMQEGDVELDALPDSPEMWAEYDVVVLGDVRPDVFTWDQLEQLRDHVAERGGGLLWIGGPAQTPRWWWDTPLGELLPFTRSASAGVALGEPFLLGPTPAADRLGVLRLDDAAADGWPAELADADTGWSALHWGQAIDPRDLKPTTEVLARGALAYSGDEWPMLTMMRYGAGKSLYLATDEIWRYRYGRGEVYYERFWLQLIRMLAREGLTRAGRPAVLTLSADRVMAEQPVRLTVELLDQSLVDLALPSIEARLTRDPEPGSDAPPRVETVTLEREPGSERVFTSSWLSDEPGSWTVELADAELASAGLTARVEVTTSSRELRTPESDHPRLEALSATTGGRALTPATLGEVFEHLPNRRERLRTELAESLWDTPLALLTILGLLTLEWVGRRVIRLI